MTAESFIQELKRLTPSLLEQEESKNNDILKVMSEEWAGDFHKPFEKKSSDPVMNLVLNAMRGPTVSHLSFRNKIINSGSYTIFGSVAEDSLDINLKTQEINLIRVSDDTILFHCSINSSSFLKAILYYCEYISAQSLSCDKIEYVEHMRRSVSAAGGEYYAPFYEYLYSL